MDTKAVSPMVATMLLIFFAVALGTVIMTWGSSYAAHQGQLEEKKEEAQIRCERFAKIVAGDGICASAIKKRLTFSVQNSGNIPIDGLRIILIGNNNFETTFFDIKDANIGPGESKTFQQNYDYARLGHIGQIEIYPKIFLDDSKTEQFRCPEKIIVDAVAEC